MNKYIIIGLVFMALIVIIGLIWYMLGGDITSTAAAVGDIFGAYTPTPTTKSAEGTTKYVPGSGSGSGGTTTSSTDGGGTPQEPSPTEPPVDEETYDVCEYVEWGASEWTGGQGTTLVPDGSTSHLLIPSEHKTEDDAHHACSENTECASVYKKIGNIYKGVEEKLTYHLYKGGSRWKNYSGWGGRLSTNQRHYNGKCQPKIVFPS